MEFFFFFILVDQSSFIDFSMCLGNYVPDVAFIVTVMTDVILYQYNSSGQFFSNANVHCKCEISDLQLDDIQEDICYDSYG